MASMPECPTCGHNGKVRLHAQWGRSSTRPRHRFTCAGCGWRYVNHELAAAIIWRLPVLGTVATSKIPAGEPT
jgi:hypothetical protein